MKRVELRRRQNPYYDRGADLGPRRTLRLPLAVDAAFAARAKADGVSVPALLRRVLVDVDSGGAAAASGAAAVSGLGAPPSWAADIPALVERWHSLGAELGLECDARPAAEGWLASWSALQDAREVNALDGAEQVDSSKLLAQLRGAHAALQPLRRGTAGAVPANVVQLRAVR